MNVRNGRVGICALMLVSAVGALGGCATTSVPRENIVIDSDPSGAKVLISDHEVGVTPYAVNIDRDFPKHWTGRVDEREEGFAYFRRYAVLELRKDGCEPHTQAVFEADLAHDLKITLTCDPSYQAPTAQPATAPESVEQRLLQLDALKSKGLISEDEYRTQRQRILDGL